MSYDPVYQQEWYGKNKKTYNETRKERYKNDPELRNKAKTRAANRREALRLPKPVGMDVTFNEAADKLGVSLWTLRGWRDKSYFPEPAKHGGRLWFSTSQLALLEKLRDFVQENGIRVGQTKRGKLEDLSNFICANW